LPVLLAALSVYAAGVLEWKVANFAEKLATL